MNAGTLLPLAALVVVAAGAEPAVEPPGGAVALGGAAVAAFAAAPVADSVTGISGGDCVGPEVVLLRFVEEDAPAPAPAFGVVLPVAVLPTVLPAVVDVACWPTGGCCTTVTVLAPFAATGPTAAAPVVAGCVV